MTRPCTLTSAPPLCAHEPLIRRALEAAERLIPELTPAGWTGLHDAGCVSAVIPCRDCDRKRLELALELLRRSRPLFADGCLAPRVIEMRATIDGLVDQIVGLKHTARELAEGLRAARERIVERGESSGLLSAGGVTVGQSGENTLFNREQSR